MKKHTIIGILIMVFLLAIPAISYAELTTSFGGKVLATKLPITTCIGFGSGPVVLYSNLLSAVVTGVAASGVGGQSIATRTNGVVSGLYGAIPFYTKYGVAADYGGFHFVGAVPKAGDWILGQASVIPDLSTCYINGVGIPFPVRDTSNYKTSSNSTSNSGTCNGDSWTTCE